VFSGTSPDERLIEAIELETGTHPFFVASQFHPEFKSRPERPAPLFREFVGAALEHMRARRGTEADPGAQAKEPAPAAPPAAT
jgi:CTP synthase